MSIYYICEYSSYDSKINKKPLFYTSENIIIYIYIFTNMFVICLFFFPEYKSIKKWNYI